MSGSDPGSKRRGRLQFFCTFWRLLEAFGNKCVTACWIQTLCNASPNLTMIIYFSSDTFSTEDKMAGWLNMIGAQCAEFLHMGALVEGVDKVFAAGGLCSHPSVRRHISKYWLARNVLFGRVGLSQLIRDVETMLVYCWASVVDGGPTINQHCFNVRCLLVPFGTICRHILQIWVFWQF